MWKGGAAGATQPEDDGLHDLLVQLDSLFRSARKNYKQIIKVSDQVLAISPTDLDALTCKVTALINTDNITEGLSVIQSAPVEVDFGYQKAYCLYRLGRYTEVLDILEGLEKCPGVYQLKAQTFYKQGDLSSCIDAYEALHREFGIDSNEVKSNAIAAYVAGGRSIVASQHMAAMQVNPKALFELAYNTACVLIEQGELSQAEEHLLLARRLGQETFLEDEYSEEEIEDELAPVTAQLAYVQQLQGRTSEAVENCLSILKRDLKDKDLATVAVVSNNLAALRKNKDASDSLRKLEILVKKDADGKSLQFAEALQQKFSPLQKEAIVYNYFLLLLSSNKLNQARELLPSIMDQYKDSSMPAVLKACLLLKEGKIESAEEVLGEHAEKKAGVVTEALLLCAQARSSSGHYLEAADVLLKVADLKHMPALVATVVDLKERGGDAAGAEQVLMDAVEWWDNSMEERLETLELLIHETAKLKLKNKDLKGASKLFERLTQSSSQTIRLEAVTGLVSCCAETDPAKAESFKTELPSLEVVDVDKLEASSSLPGGITPAEASKKEMQERAGQEKKKRKRKPRYPKGFDPENPGPPPDPERWLPRRERSSTKPRKKDKRAAMRGSQGAISKDAGPVSNGPSSSSKPVESKPSGSGSGSGGNARNRKKSRR